MNFLLRQKIRKELQFHQKLEVKEFQSVIQAVTAVRRTNKYTWDLGLNNLKKKFLFNKKKRN